MQFTLIAGLMLRNGERTLEVARELEKDEYLLEDVQTRRPTVLSRSLLLKRIYDKEYVVVSGAHVATDSVKVDWPAVIDLSSLKEHERTRLEYRLSYVKALRRKQISRGQRSRIAAVIKAFAAKTGDADPPSASTVMLWVRSYENSSMNPLSLVDKHRVRSRVKRVTSEVERILWKVLKRSYFTKDRHTLKHAYDQLCARLKQAVHNKEVAQEEAQVSYATLQRRVMDVDLYHRIASREGPARARMVCRTAFPEGVAQYPLQRVEIDHTPLNWVVICDVTGLPLGRPTLTVMIDAFSGYLLGFYLSFHGPGLTSVAGVARNAILPKDDIVAGFGLKYPWLAHGMGDEWVIDNGLEFHSFGFKSIAMALGIDLMYCRVRTPWLKPHVERFFSSLNTLSLVKGRVRKSTPNVIRIDPYKDAAITFSDLVAGLLQYVVDVHPHEVNWRKMDTPFNLFSEGIDKCPPAIYPGSMEQLKLAAGMSKRLTFGQGGIEMLGLPYGSYDFGPLAKKHGTGLKLLCKWDPDDISQLYVQLPDEVNWITAECKWMQYAQGLSYNQHRLIRDFRRKELKAPETLESQLMARLRLHEHWMDTTSRRGRADALLAGRSRDLTSHKMFTQASGESSPYPRPAQAASQFLAQEEMRYSEQDIPDFEAFTF